VSKRERERERERERKRQTDRQTETDRQTDRDRERGEDYFMRKSVNDYNGATKRTSWKKKR